MNKKLELASKILFIAMPLTVFIISLVLYIRSFEFYSDEWGADISFDSDQMVIMMVSLIVLTYTIYSLYCYKKNIKESLAKYYVASVSTLILAFYPLGKFFEYLAKSIKNLNKGKITDLYSEFYLVYKHYLFIGIVFLVIFAYALINLIIAKSNNKNGLSD